MEQGMTLPPNGTRAVPCVNIRGQVDTPCAIRGMGSPSVTKGGGGRASPLVLLGGRGYPLFHWGTPLVRSGGQGVTLSHLGGQGVTQAASQTPNPTITLNME